MKQKPLDQTTDDQKKAVGSKEGTKKSSAVFISKVSLERLLDNKPIVFPSKKSGQDELLGIEPALKRLIEEKADINQKFSDSKTILMKALEKDLTGLAMILIQSNHLKPNIADASGETAMHYAVRSDSSILPCVMALLNWEANPHARNTSGQTCIDVAQQKFEEATEESAKKRYAATLEVLQKHSIATSGSGSSTSSTSASTPSSSSSSSSSSSTMSPTA